MCQMKNKFFFLSDKNNFATQAETFKISQQTTERSDKEQ